MPDGLISILLFGLGLPLLTVLAISAAVYSSVKSMSHPDLWLEPVGPETHRNYYRVAERFDSFAEANGFNWEGGYLFTANQTLFVAAWKHERYPTYFCVYCHGATKNLEFTTTLSQKSLLDTSSTKDSQLMPVRPGRYVESFHGASAEDLWTQHLKSIKHLYQTLGLKPETRDASFEEEVIKGIRSQMKFIRSHFLWPLRGTWWYFIRRNVRTGRSIAQQFPA